MRHLIRHAHELQRGRVEILYEQTCKRATIVCLLFGTAAHQMDENKRKKANKTYELKTEMRYADAFIVHKIKLMSHNFVVREL